MKLPRWVQAWLPVVVSVGVFAWLLSREDIAILGVLQSIRPSQLGWLAVALLGYGSFGLALEAISLVRMVDLPLARFSTWTAAKIKAASYLAYTIHYSLGVGALSILLRRRVHLSLADSAGVVLLIAAFDLGMTILVASCGALLLGAETKAVRAGVIFSAAATMVGGFALLRAPFPLGPFDRLREFTVFRATRETPLIKITELFVLRLVFVSGFFIVAGISLRIFDIAPPLPVLFVNVSIVALIAALPIAVAGLGTGQAAFVWVFRDYGDPETLLACSLALSAGLILLRAGMGLAFAREYAREAILAAREEEA